MRVKIKNTMYRAVLQGGMALSFLLTAGFANAGDISPEPEPPAVSADGGEGDRLLLKLRVEKQRKGKVLLGTGYSMFGLAYLAGFVEGTILHFAGSLGAAWNDDGLSSYEEFSAISPVIPLIGPFFQADMLFTQGSGDDVISGSLLVMDGLMQIAGLGMIIAGHVLHDRARHERPVSPGGMTTAGGRDFGITVTAFPVSGGGGVGVSGYF